MKATQHLITEHESVLQMLDILKSAASKLSSGDKVPPADLEAMLDFLKVFVDRCHHGKEEQVLFPKLMDSGIPNEGGPVGMMLFEHVKGRGYIGGLGSGVAKYKSGDASGIPEIIENINEYAELLYAHIYKENNILYKMADVHLTAGDQEELFEAFKKTEAEALPGVMGQVYRQILERLRLKYAG